MMHCLGWDVIFFDPPKKLSKMFVAFVSVNEGMESWKNPFVNKKLGGGFKYFLYFHPYLGKMNPI